MGKRIILNADDFGPCDALNQGIYKAIDNGVVSSVSAFVTFGETNLQNIIDLKKYIDDNELNIGIGLHFTISAGKPVNKNPDRTLSYSTSGLFAQLDDFKWDVDIQEFEDEMKAQINLLASKIGGHQNIDHINCHVGISYMKKEFWKILIKQKYPVRSPNKFKKYYKKVRNGKAPILGIVIDRLWDRSTLNDNFLQKMQYIIINDGKVIRKKRYKYAIKNGIQLPFVTQFGYYKQPSKKILKNTVWQLAKSKNKHDVVEIMLHLSINDKPDDYKDYHGIDPKSFKLRTKELDVLVNSGILEYMKKHNVELINYKQI